MGFGVICMVRAFAALAITCSSVYGFMHHMCHQHLNRSPGGVFRYHPESQVTFRSSGGPQCLPRGLKPVLTGLSWDFPAFFFAN